MVQGAARRVAIPDRFRWHPDARLYGPDGAGFAPLQSRGRRLLGRACEQTAKHPASPLHYVAMRAMARAFFEETKIIARGYESAREKRNKARPARAKARFVALSMR